MITDGTINNNVNTFKFDSTVAAIYNQLLQKSNIDLNNLSSTGLGKFVLPNGTNAQFPYIVESFYSEFNFYEIYSNGRIRQGGVIDIDTSGGPYNFFKPFLAWNDYILIGSSVGGSGVGSNITFERTSGSQFKVWCNIDNGTHYNNTIAWYAEGNGS